MKNLNIDKIIIGLIVGIFIYSCYTKLKEKEETYYYIETKPYKVCDKEIYTTDFTYNQSLDIRALFAEIEYICKETYEKK